MQHVARVAKLSEQMLRPDTRSLDEADSTTGKSLLARSSADPLAPSALRLLACDADDRWEQYEDLRVAVEQGFGLTEDEARLLVRATRERGRRLGLRLWLATSPTPDQVVVGGIERLIVGADEDDWPLSWYRRLGFRRVARVDQPRQAVGRTAPMYS